MRYSTLIFSVAMLSALPAFADSSPYTFGQASRIQSLYDADGALTQLYEYTGKAVVTFVEDTGDSRLIYAQDFTGAFCLNAPAETAVTRGDESLIEDIECLEEGCVGGCLDIRVSHESALRTGILLTPDLEIYSHYIVFHCDFFLADL